MLLLRFIHDWLIASCCLLRRSCESLYIQILPRVNIMQKPELEEFWFYNYLSLTDVDCINLPANLNIKVFGWDWWLAVNMKGSIYLEANQKLGARKMENWEMEGRLNDNLTKTEGSVEKLKNNYSLQHFPCYLFFTTVENLMRWRRVGRRISKEKQETP